MVRSISFDNLRTNTPSRHSLDNRSTTSLASVSRKDKNLVDSVEHKVKLQGVGKSSQVGKSRYSTHPRFGEKEEESSQ